MASRQSAAVVEPLLTASAVDHERPPRDSRLSMDDHRDAIARPADRPRPERAA